MTITPPNPNISRPRSALGAPGNGADAGQPRLAAGLSGLDNSRSRG